MFSLKLLAAFVVKAGWEGTECSSSTSCNAKMIEAQSIYQVIVSEIDPDGW